MWEIKDLIKHCYICLVSFYTILYLHSCLLDTCFAHIILYLYNVLFPQFFLCEIIYLLSPLLVQSFIIKIKMLALAHISLIASFHPVKCWKQSLFQKRGKAQQLLDQVFDHLELVEKDYFGLQYIDPSPGEDSLVKIR